MPRGFGGPPVFRGPPLGRGGMGCLGLIGWIFPGLLGFLLGKSYADSRRAPHDDDELRRREDELRYREREAELRRREDELEQREEELRRRAQP